MTGLFEQLLIPFPGCHNLWHLPGKLQRERNSVCQHAIPETDSKQTILDEIIS